MSITARPAPNAAPARLKVRKSIDSLSAQELADFRRAVKQALALNDKRGFDYFASWHGVPFGWCQHHDPLFLPWHRAYLYWLELALQSEVPGVTLPWWDWSKDAAIPSAYSSAQADGEENVLAKAPIKAFNTAHKSGWPTETSRAPGEIPQTPGPPYQQEWAYAMKADHLYRLQPADLDACTTPSTSGSAAPSPRSTGPPTTRCSSPTMPTSTGRGGSGRRPTRAPIPPPTCSRQSLQTDPAHGRAGDA